MAIAKATGMPILPDLTTADELPHHLSFMINYRARINSFQELPKDKRPPKNLWDKAHKLEKYFDEVFSTDSKKDNKFIEFDVEDVD
jgi:hypothetical protein